MILLSVDYAFYKTSLNNKSELVLWETQDRQSSVSNNFSDDFGISSHFYSVILSSFTDHTV